MIELKTDSMTTTVAEPDLIAHGDPDVTYTIRPISRAFYQEIVTKNAKGLKAANRGLMLDEQFRLLVALNEALFDYALVGWSGITVNGEPAPCDATHKALIEGAIMEAVVQFAASPRRAVTTGGSDHA